MTDQYLSNRVSEAEDHAEEFQARKNVEDRIASEKEGLREVTDELEALQSSVQELLWYQAVLEEVFKQDTDGTDSALDEVRNIVCDDLEDSVAGVIDSDFSKFEEKSDDVADTVAESAEDLEEQLEARQEEWEDRIARARQLIGIPGLLSDEDKAELEEASDAIETFVGDTIWEVSPTGEIDELRSEWDSLTSTFNEHRTVHGYDNVQEEYGISDEAMERLRELVEENETELQKFDPETLQDLKKFEELIKQVKVSFRG